MQAAVRALAPALFACVRDAAPVATLLARGDEAAVEGAGTLLLGVSMQQGGDVIALGHALDKKIARIGQSLPVGLSISTFTSQPQNCGTFGE